MGNIYDDSENNNAPDYENNLAFDPTSADDLNEQGRQSEVLIKALEKCEKLEKENQQLKELLYKCREKLDWLNGGYDVWGGELTDFIEEIDNAIGNSDDKK